MSFQSTNLPQKDIESSIAYFSTLYDSPISVTQNISDALFAFFISRTENKEAALALVNAVIITSLDNQIDPMAVLDGFRKIKDDITLDIQLVAFLNLSREQTSVLGVINSPKVNKHITRTILG